MEFIAVIHDLNGHQVDAAPGPYSEVVNAIKADIQEEGHQWLAVWVVPFNEETGLPEYDLCGEYFSWRNNPDYTQDFLKWVRDEQ